VRGVLKLEEFGVPEAFWMLEVKDFPVVVTMDSHGVSLHDEIGAESEKKMKEILAGLGK
jgi:fumarate hydratase class I